MESKDGRNRRDISGFNRIDGSIGKTLVVRYGRTSSSTGRIIPKTWKWDPHSHRAVTIGFEWNGTLAPRIASLYYQFTAARAN